MFLWPAVISTIFCFNNKPSSGLLHPIVVYSVYLLKRFCLRFRRKQIDFFLSGKTPVCHQNEAAEGLYKTWTRPSIWSPTGPIFGPLVDPIWTSSGYPIYFSFPVPHPQPRSCVPAISDSQSAANPHKMKTTKTHCSACMQRFSDYDLVIISETEYIQNTWIAMYMSWFEIIESFLYPLNHADNG